MNDWDYQRLAAMQAQSINDELRELRRQVRRLRQLVAILFIAGSITWLIQFL
jgi:hypothetical protein